MSILLAYIPHSILEHSFFLLIIFNTGSRLSPRFLHTHILPHFSTYLPLSSHTFDGTLFHPLQETLFFGCLLLLPRDRQDMMDNYSI
jgi:hypothetical protein